MPWERFDQKLASESQGKTPDPVPLLKERHIRHPGELSVRSYSKEHLALERQELAKSLRRERNEKRDTLGQLRIRADQLREEIERAEQNFDTVQEELNTLISQRATEAGSLVGRIKDFVGLQTPHDHKLQEVITSTTERLDANEKERGKTVDELSKHINQLIDTDTALKALKEKINLHYTEASDTIQRAVEQTMLRTNSFFVHTINEDPMLRHNKNSNVSAGATFEDDLDILLSLEPSLSASSVLPGSDQEGRVSGLWSHSGGVLIAGGRITAAHTRDIGSISQGIKHRYAFTESNKTVEEIDTIVTNSRNSLPGEIGGYNELVIDNPEISGYFAPGTVDKDGRYWATGPEAREERQKISEAYYYSNDTDAFHTDLDEFHHHFVEPYQKRFDIIKARGLPFYMMTPDRRFFEVTKILPTGRLEVGSELTPEQAAFGPAGLPPEQRKQMGTQLLERSRTIFRDQRTYTEARMVIDHLSKDEDIPSSQ